MNARVTDHFSRQFSDSAIRELPVFTGKPSQLPHPITTEEVKRAIGRLNSGRASGHGDIPADKFEMRGRPASRHDYQHLQRCVGRRRTDRPRQRCARVTAEAGGTDRIVGEYASGSLAINTQKDTVIVSSRIAPKVDKFLGESELRMIRSLLAVTSLARPASINWRLSFIRDNHQYTARRQPQPGIIYRISSKRNSEKRHRPRRPHTGRVAHNTQAWAAH